MRRLRVTQMVFWPALLAPTLAVIGAEFVAVAAGWIGWVPPPVRLFVYSTACVAAVMTGMTRCIGPVSEAYRLGMSAGAREERQRHEQAARELMRTAVGDDSGGWRIDPPRRARPLTLVRD